MIAERTYAVMDKSEWGDGPWQDEPDKVQWRDDATGLPCLAVRNRVGAWCGYVGVDPEHPLYGADYDKAYEIAGDDAIRVHGGLTYSAPCSDEEPESSGICHVPDPGEPEHVWWLGFDCAHSGDLAPVMAANDRKRYEETGDSLWRPRPGYHYRDLDYAKREVTDLAAQISSLTKGLSL